ncbi:MAG: hypothetical protein ACK41P_06420 [Asticcacaulis sp.]
MSDTHFDAQQALTYAKRLDLGQSALAYIVIAVAFLVFMGPEPILKVILGAIGAGLLIQAVFAPRNHPPAHRQPRTRPD